VFDGALYDSYPETSAYEIALDTQLEEIIGAEHDCGAER